MYRTQKKIPSHFFRAKERLESPDLAVSQDPPVSLESLVCLGCQAQMVREACLALRVDVAFLETPDLKAETDLKETEEILAHLVSV
jgi:hypothetical protein